MIHQFIFAAPKPGMTEEAFQRYWVEVHAVQYASKIPQIRRYLIDTRIQLRGESGEPEWSGVAEIWLDNEQDQLESLQSKEFLEGARLDEPNWAAFWRTVVLDTTAHEIVSGPPPARNGAGAKLLVFFKRREGLPLERFRSYALDEHAAMVRDVPGVRRYVQGHVRDAAYGVGEALLDCVEQLWFDDVDGALAAQSSLEWDTVKADYRLFAEERYVHTMLVREHWIIGPELRPYTGVLQTSS